MKNTIFILATLILLTNCKKLRPKDTLTVDLTCVNPINGDPYPNVKYQIYEVKTKSNITGIKEKKELIYSGATNANGKSFYELKAIENSKFSYEIYFDYSEMDVPTGNYDLSKTRDFDYLKKNQNNVYEFTIFPYISFIQNINCFDSNDKMRFRSKKLFSSGTPTWSF